MSKKEPKTSSIDLIASHLTRVEQEMKNRFINLEQEMNARFQDVGERFASVDERFERLEHKIDRNHSELVGMLDESIRKSDRLDKERIVHAYRLDRLEQTVFSTK